MKNLMRTSVGNRASVTGEDAGTGKKRRSSIQDEIITSDYAEDLDVRNDNIGVDSGRASRRKSSVFGGSA